MEKATETAAREAPNSSCNGAKKSSKGIRAAEAHQEDEEGSGNRISAVPGICRWNFPHVAPAVMG
jgi:hypothetical protein